MNAPVVMLDFDETLFDHRKYINALADIIPDVFGVDPEPMIRTFEYFHDRQDEEGLLELYRHKQHVRRTTGLSWSTFSGLVAEQVQVRGIDLCYPDASEFLELAIRSFSQVRILTYGREAYQRYKISLCPQVVRLPVHVVEERKADFLSREFGPEKNLSGVLVDDRAPLYLPKNWSHIWINRNGKDRPVNYDCDEVDALDFRVVTNVLSGARTT